MQIDATDLPGCFHLHPAVRPDARGRFVKTFEHGVFAERGLATRYEETFFSQSHRGVLRGLHFQAPPFHHAKLVACPAGRVLDVVLDLRADSPAFGQSAVFELSGADGGAVYVPEGCAHGFYTLEENTLMSYQVTVGHAPGHDCGVRWDSIGIDWPAATPLLSERDQGLPGWADFCTPFDAAGRWRLRQAA